MGEDALLPPTHHLDGETFVARACARVRRGNIYEAEKCFPVGVVCGGEEGILPHMLIPSVPRGSPRRGNIYEVQEMFPRRGDSDKCFPVGVVRHCFGDRPDGETFANLGLDGETFS